MFQVAFLTVCTVFALGVLYKTADQMITDFKKEISRS